jgi:hypothetical protein
MKNTIWVLTREINEYNQDGEYFVCVFKEKPSIDKFREVINEAKHGYAIISEQKILHYYENKGRLGMEDEWFYLEEKEFKD